MRVKHWCTGEITDMPVSEVMHEVISCGNGEVHGSLENLEAKVEVLTKSLSVLIAYIGEAAAEKIISSMICPVYHLIPAPLTKKEEVENAYESVQPEPFIPRGE